MVIEPFEQIGGYLGRFGKIFAVIDVLGKRELGRCGWWCHGFVVSIEFAHLVIVIVHFRPLLQDSIGLNERSTVRGSRANGHLSFGLTGQLFRNVHGI